ncbi:MAG: MmgE/PrpD family protein [Dehalococcoidales bacterium]
MNETRELANFIVGTKYSDLSKEVIEKAKILMLDQFGCELAFSVMAPSKAVYEYVKGRKGTRTDSTVVYYGLKTVPEDAAFANAVFGHGFEMDDTELRTTSHPGVAVIPAAIAMGEMESVTGKELITSIVVGYDVMIRIGIASRSMQERGFHTTGVLGPFGSTAAACKALALDAATVANALGITASQCGGIAEYTRSGGSVKRLHAGFAAHAGVKAALLARLGVTGPPTAIEGEKGFCQAYADKYSLKDITDGLGREFRILWTGNKPYCCCLAQHAVIDATALIASNSRLKPGDIEEIVVGQKAREAGSVGVIIEPTDVVSAQFSARFGLATRLIKGGNQFRDYSDRNIRDPRILALARKVKYIVDEELEKMPPDSNPAKVTIKLKNGTVYQERVDYSKGTIQNPMTREELEAKFRSLASTVMPEKKVEDIILATRRLEEMDNVNKLGTLLTAGGETPSRNNKGTVKIR